MLPQQLRDLVETYAREYAHLDYVLNTGDGNPSDQRNTLRRASLELDQFFDRFALSAFPGKVALVASIAGQLLTSRFSEDLEGGARLSSLMAGHGLREFVHIARALVDQTLELEAEDRIALAPDEPRARPS